MSTARPYVEFLNATKEACLHTAAVNSLHVHLGMDDWTPLVERLKDDEEPEPDQIDQIFCPVCLENKYLLHCYLGRVNLGPPAAPENDELFQAITCAVCMRTVAMVGAGWGPVLSSWMAGVPSSWNGGGPEQGSIKMLLDVNKGRLDGEAQTRRLTGQNKEDIYSLFEAVETIDRD